MNVHRYQGFGLTLESNVALPALLPSVGAGPADVRLLLGADAEPLPTSRASLELCYTSPYRDADGSPQLRLWKSGEGFLRLEYRDATTVVIDKGGTRVWATWAPDATLEDTATYLLGPVLGLVLRLRGITCLHASCVAVADGCIAFAGASGAGKSSVAALFARNGHAVLSDDVVPLHAGTAAVVAVPTYPRVRLWADSTASLFGAEDALPLIVPGWEKRYLDVAGTAYAFHSQPLPVRAVYVLSDQRTSDRAPSIGGCDPRMALMRLVANTYTSYVGSPSTQARDLDVFAQLSAGAAVRELALPESFDNALIYRDLMQDAERWIARDKVHEAAA
jgi:hypothetical protein